MAPAGAGPTAAAVVEVPLLFESGMEAVFDATIAVMADEASASGAPPPAGTRRSPSARGASSPRREKAQRADYTVRNDGTLDELKQALSQRT